MVEVQLLSALTASSATLIVPLLWFFMWLPAKTHVTGVGAPTHLTTSLLSDSSLNERDSA